MSVIPCICRVAVTTCSHFIHHQSLFHSCRGCPCWLKLNTGEMDELFTFSDALLLEALEWVAYVACLPDCIWHTGYKDHCQSLLSVKEVSVIPDCADLTVYFPAFLTCSSTGGSLNTAFNFHFKSSHFVQEEHGSCCYCF